jgi:HD-like signal output (HDOD) protein
MTFIGNKVKNKIPVDMLYTIGLFHDCGIPLLAIKHANYKDLLIDANNSGVAPVELEQKYYQTSHAIVGYFVASSWNMPKDICQIILQHHENDVLENITGSTEQLAYAVLKAAENLEEHSKRYNYSPNWLELEDSVLDTLGITSIDYSDLEEDFAELLN